MKSVFKRLYFYAFTFCLLFCTFSIVGFGQNLDYVTISGQITDPNNAAIAGATVTARLTTTGVERTVVTNEDGIYRILNLEPGNYTVRFTSQGFAAKEQTNVNTIAGQNVQLNISLLPAGVTAEQTITITDEPPAVDVTRTVVGGTVTQREIEELPSQSRNPLDLIFTLGGVTEEPLSTRDLARDRGTRGEGAPSNTPEEAGSFSLSGGAAYSNNITIDGLDNNDDRAATVRFTPSLDAISEVQVITNQFSAEYGRASGGRVNFRTRAGGKKFRGRASYFFEDESLNANTWRNNSRGIPRPARQEHIPVFSFGGPIPFGYFKNKTFFFGAYEYQNLKEDTVIDTYLPVQQNTRFELPAPTNLNGQVNIGTAASPIFVAPYFEGVPTPLRNHTLSARLDHNFTDTHNVTFNFQYGNREDFRQFSGGSRLAEALIGNTRSTQGYSFTDNYVFSSNLVNQARFQYSTLKPRVVSDVPLTAPVILISVPALLDRGGTTITAGSSTSSSSDRTEQRWQFQDSLNVIYGSHTFKLGGDIQHVRSSYTDRSDATGTFRFSTVADFLNNNVTSYQQNFGAISEQQNTYTGLFFQDDWRIRQNLTFSYGLRYERETIIEDNNNFGPRVGIAWSPFKEGKGVIRFGAGIFYNRALLRTIDDFTLTTSGDELVFSTGNIPAGSARNAVLANLSQRFPQPLTREDVQQICTANNLTCAGSGAFGRILDPEIKLPESYQFNVGFEREIGKGFVFEVNYTYNKTARLWREVSSNAVSLAKLNAVTGGNFNSLSEYLLSRDFDNRPVNGTRPFIGGTTSTSGNFIRFTTTPFNPSAPGAQSSLGSAANPNPDLGGIICINGAATCANSTNNPNLNRYYLINLNSLSATNGSAPITTALAVLQQFRPDPTRGQLEYLTSIGNSEYNGLILELRRRYRKLGYGFGSSFRIVYTLSKLMDDGIVNTSSAQIAGNFQAEWARSLQDRRHRLAISGVFDTPYWLGKLRFSPILRYGSSAPFNLSGGGVDRNLDDVNTDRPNFSGNLDSIVYRNPGDPFPQALFDALTRPTIGTIGGNLPRNAGRGPSLFLFDMNISREFKFTERFRFRPNIEINNVFNSRVFNFGSGFINSTDPQTSFLVPTRTFRPRQIRIGFRFDF